jgi:hypothetical protein
MNSIEMEEIFVPGRYQPRLRGQAWSSEKWKRGATRIHSFLHVKRIHEPNNRTLQTDLSIKAHIIKVLGKPTHQAHCDMEFFPALAFAASSLGLAKAVKAGESHAGASSSR